MNERTYTLGTGDEVMVQFDEDDAVIDVYAYNDIASEHRHLFTVEGQNPVFVHAGDTDAAWEYVCRRAIDWND